MTKPTDPQSRLADLCIELEDVRRAKRETAKEYGEQITDLTRRIQRLASDISTGQKSIGDD